MKREENSELNPTKKQHPSIQYSGMCARLLIKCSSRTQPGAAPLGQRERSQRWNPPLRAVVSCGDCRVRQSIAPMAMAVGSQGSSRVIVLCIGVKAAAAVRGASVDLFQFIDRFL